MKFESTASSWMSRIDMCWIKFVFCLTIVATCTAINRPVYKIVLTQKGFTQFLQYDVETPPLREFTFCTWIRLYDLQGDQTIFTYVANGNNRVIRLWLDSGGRFLRVAINDKRTSSTAVEITKDVWRHICISYQSNYGAWALYMDAKLISCESHQNLYGFVLPSAGSVIVGYGSDDTGIQKGLEGEIFGANMILSSTIERNHTIAQDYYYQQKPFIQNRVKENEKDIKYIILNDLRTDDIHNTFEKSPILLAKNRTRNKNKLKKSHFLDNLPSKTNANDFSIEREILNLPYEENSQTSTAKPINFWNLVNEAGKVGRFKGHLKNQNGTEQSGSSTQELASVSEFETPPPPNSAFNEQFRNKLETFKSPRSTSLYNLNIGNKNVKTNMLNEETESLSDFESPPPIQNDKKVYGQWTSSKFASSVLDYLKNINFYNREKKPPATIPLTKLSESHPYATEFKITKLRPPVQFQRKNLLERGRRIRKRNANNQPKINVQILKDDLRTSILKNHAKIEVSNVEIFNRGQLNKFKENRFHRSAAVSDESSEESSESEEEIYKPKPFTVSTIKSGSKNTNMRDFDTHISLMTILPFLKSLEYFVEDSEDNGSENVLRNSDDMYLKSLSNGNKWHNMKTYSNDYTPRRINLDSKDGSNDIADKIAEVNKKQHPSIRLKYKHENNNLVKKYDDYSIVKGRELAMQVSNQSNLDSGSISIVKYNHGYLPSQDQSVKPTSKSKTPFKRNSKSKRVDGKNEFNKQVKLGNALNERHVLGRNEEQKKKSFVGGDENIPDINRYRSEIDHENGYVPPSLGPRICNSGMFDKRVLYVQPDHSIDASHIVSPVKKKNLAIQFIQQNYNKCSLQGSNFEKNYLLFIDWSKTPVRLFGGAYPKRTTDLCGFF